MVVPVHGPQKDKKGIAPFNKSPAELSRTRARNLVSRNRIRASNRLNGRPFMSSRRLTIVNVQQARAKTFLS